MRIIFMGTPEFAVPTLEAVHQIGHDIIAVFSQPDRPSGRGRNINFPPVKQKALGLGLSIYQPEILKTTETIQVISSLEPDALVVVAYGLYLPKSILNTPRLGAINLHPSLLPRYRGAAPINHALLKGEEVTGVTSILMNSRMDAGDIILQEEVSIDPGENAGELEERLAKLGAGLIVRSLEVLESTRSGFRKQDESLVSYAPKLSPKDGHIDWGRSTVEIQSQVRGLTPRPGAYAMFKGKRLEVLEATPNIEYRVTDNEARPGQVAAAKKNTGLVIKTGNGALSLITVKPQGKNAMSGVEFLRGYKPEEGEILS